MSKYYIKKEKVWDEEVMNWSYEYQVISKGNIFLKCISGALFTILTILIIIPLHFQDLGHLVILWIPLVFLGFAFLIMGIEGMEKKFKKRKTAQIYIDGLENE